MEVWKDIPGYEGAYQVSDQGRARSLDRHVWVERQRKKGGWCFRAGRVLSPSLPNKSVKYSVVNLHTSAGGKTFLVHRLVALAFIPNDEGKPEVNHKNGVRTDNRAINLEWASRRENAHHARDVLGKQYRGKTVEAVFDSGERRVYPNQRAAEVALVGGDTGIVSWALKNGRKALGASWRRM